MDSIIIVITYETIKLAFYVVYVFVWIILADAFFP